MAKRKKSLTVAVDSKEAEEGTSGSTCCTVASSSPMFIHCPLSQRYEVEAEIGEGGQGRVSRVKRRSDGSLFACKTVRIPKSKSSQLIRDEVRILERLKSFGVAGVVGFVEVIVDSVFWHVILELCTCSLHDRILREQGLTHREAALLIKRLAKVVEDLHRVGVVHRDLKPPNVLLTYPDFPHYNVRVADFGLSVMFPGDEEQPIEGTAGTYKYIAPEVIRANSYDKAVDVWGLGLIMYEVVSGLTAFESMKTKVVMSRLGWVDSPGEMLDWTGIEADVKAFIMGMLCVDPKKRLTPEEIQTHPWVLKNTEEELAPRTPPSTNIIRFKQVDGKWLPLCQAVELERRKEEKAKRKRIALQRKARKAQIAQPSSKTRKRKAEDGAPLRKIIIRVKVADSKWVGQCKRDQQRKQVEREEKAKAGQRPEGVKLRFRCVNGLWEVVK